MRMHLLWEIDVSKPEHLPSICLTLSVMSTAFQSDIDRVVSILGLGSSTCEYEFVWATV